MSQKPPHRQTDPPFSEFEIAEEEDDDRKDWMIRQNVEWEMDMEEERRERHRREHGF